MHNYINESGDVVGAIPYDSMSYYILYYKNDIHAPAALQKPFRLFGF